MEEKTWLERKKQFYKRMLEDREIGYLDPGIETLLERFFEKEGLYTTSSCIGRITIVEGIYPWDREEARVVFKKHGEIKGDIILKQVEIPGYENLWLRVTGPILHVVAKDRAWANWIIDLARKAGFKHSCIFSLGRDIVVEIMSSIQISIPLKIGGVLLIPYSHYDSLADLANKLWRKGVESARILEKLLEETPDP
ncbi:MAG: hypothetical protein LRS47_01545 [Desulfurococcales archaeon]|nr:hypothetical protein [Desulfurococcales archaeon]